MDVDDGLRQLGLSEYEARAYAALLAHPGANGYEVAKHSGIPRAKIYEVLAALVAKDVVQTSEDDERVRYHPLDPDALLARHLGRARQLARELSPQLKRLAGSEASPALVTVHSYERVLARARDVLASAARRAFVSGWPDEIAALAPDLEHTEARGVAVYALVYGDVSRPIPRLVKHHPIDPLSLGNRRVSSLPWLIVVADNVAVLISEAVPGDQTVALWTRNRTLAMVAAEYVKHDIFLVELDALLQERGINLDRELWPLQAMWFDDCEENA